MTVTIAEVPLTEPSTVDVAVTVNVPVETAVIFPLASTVATDGLLDVHVTLDEASAGDTTATASVVDPTPIDYLATDTFIAVGGVAGV